jgi:fermentation-respiration switch protein FrsA (DUF1100 family)
VVKRLITALLLLAFALPVTVLALFWIGQRRLIYYPSGDVERPGDVGLPRAEAVTFTTEDDLTLHGWFVPSETAPSLGTVIVFNGNAGNRAYRADLGRAFAHHGYAVLLFDYRGYGGNAGSPSETGLTRDAQAALRFVTSRPGVDATRIIYFGESLGAAVAIRLAVEHPPRALILRSPFSSLVDVARHHFSWLPVGLLLSDRFPSLDRITTIRCPLLVIAGDRDTIVPAEQSRRLFAAALEPKQLLIVAHADHNDEALAGGSVVAAVDRFVRGLPR